MKAKKSSFGKAFLKPFCFAKAFTENTSWKKRFALVEIAIVLCSVFLVAALPVIAADQNVQQETQKVSASSITTASEDDFVLGIYGNANEDDTIDMGDVVYTKLAIFGKKPKTELCDAKYDGRINVLDVIQTKLIILGKEREITVIDTLDRIVTVKKPVNRIINLMWITSEITQAIGAKDKVVGVGSLIGGDAFLTELNKLPKVGSWMKPDYEAIIGLKPDLVTQLKTGTPELEDKLEPAGITVVRLELDYTGGMGENLIKLGYILDRVDKAKDLRDWHSEYLDQIKSRTEKLSDDEKPRVFIGASYYGSDKASGNKDSLGQLCSLAGGFNIAGDLEESFEVDTEWVIVQNPDVIVLKTFSFEAANGYGTDDPTEMKEFREKIMSRPAWKNINAVKNERVYILAWGLSSGPHALVTTAYLAKWFYPELFEDLDPKAIHQEYLTRFLHLDYDLDEHGVFAYPEDPV